MILFTSGTGTGVGKTFITTKINQALMQKGLNICSLKPIETGVKDSPQDAFLHQAHQSKKLSIDEICFYTFPLPSAPYIADTHNIIDINHIKTKIKIFKKQYDIVVIEGAGGLFVPIKKDYFFIDLIKDLKAFCLLICDDKLGCINQILTHRNLLENQKIPFFSINNLLSQNDFYDISYPFLKQLKRHFVFQTQQKELIDEILLLKDSVFI